jgi:hypothetical protein
MKKIYIVMASSGEYDTRADWPVKAFFNKNDAKQYIEKVRHIEEKRLERLLGKISDEFEVIEKEEKIYYTLSSVPLILKSF